MKPEQEAASCGKKMSLKQSFIYNLTYIRYDNIDRFTKFFLRYFDDSIFPGSVFRLIKKDTKENSEDASEGDPEENTAGEQP